jgi:hypothetical protein
MRLLWDAFPRANPFEVAVEAVKVWNIAGLRWLLDHKMGALSSCDLCRLFERACLSGSYLCGSSVLVVLGFSASPASHVRGLRPVGVVGRVLLGGLASLKSGRFTSFHLEDSTAAAYAEELTEWLPDATGFKLAARHEGRGAASVNAFINAAKGQAKTLTVVETENGVSICGGYLDVPWIEDGYASDRGRGSFIFTLRNHLGVPPTRFAQKRDDSVTHMMRSYRFCFGSGEGFTVRQDNQTLYSDCAYEASCHGVALFDGDEDGVFRAARWELWEVE